MIFLDSSFLIARLIKNDKNHARALSIEGQLNEKRYINNTVLTETLNSFTNVGGKLGKQLFFALSEINEIIYLSQEDYEKSLDIYLHYDSSINYADCTILESMEKLGLNKIVTFDSDFEKINGLEIIK
ncbi:MAG: PIN domain-containing protein [Methanobacteriaceae archaeon]|nr:PIN domain-containing protein [Methanobacteriaceae archaeon]